MIPPLQKSAVARKDARAVSVHFRPEAILRAEHEALGLAFAHVVGALLTTFLAGAVAWNHWQFSSVIEERALVFVATGAYALAAIATARMTSLPRSAPLAAILITTTISFTVALAALAAIRLPYSRLYLSSAWILAMLCQAAAYGVQPRIYPRFAILPGKMTDRLRSVPGASWIPVEEADHSEVDAIVLDPSTDGSPDWAGPVADWKLRGMKLVDARAVYEMFTGRVQVDPVYSTHLELAEPHVVYPALRRCIELISLFLMLPLLLPLSLFVAALVKIDSRGPALFWQDRVGFRGTPFKMCKFRTMRIDAEVAGPQFATVRDWRITRLGRFLRQSRLDELPQLWNVLRGDMSIIGPRPEQTSFARRFEQELPTYTYRHLVKPGITGWAQVNQGYAANSAETRTKLEFDLYYVKNLSACLDASIILKTFRTIATGFGAR